MFEQKTNQVMNLDCIENVEQIDDLAAETIAAGKFDVQLFKNGTLVPVHSEDNHITIDLKDSSAEYSLQMYNNSDSWKYFDVSLHDGSSGRRIAHTHRSHFGAEANSWTKITNVYDEMHSLNNYENRKFYLEVVKK